MIHLVRSCWRSEPNLSEFAARIAGSADLYERSGRRPVASINFVTAHDGFTLRDLVSYNDKHGIAGKDATGNPVVDEHALLYFNGGPDPVEVSLPTEEYSQSWDVAIDTAASAPENTPLPAGSSRSLEGHSVVVLMQHTAAATEPDLSAAASVAMMTHQAQ